MSKQTLHGFVTGKVQGVWYRESMRKQAIRLNITGWVRNLQDGRVEFVICGEANDLQRLLDWAASGPMLAKVEHLDTESMESQDFSEFVVRATA